MNEGEHPLVLASILKPKTKKAQIFLINVLSERKLSGAGAGN